MPASVAMPNGSPKSSHAIAAVHGGTRYKRLVTSVAATQLGLSPSEGLAACTVNAAHVLGRADRLGRLARGYAADLVLIDAPDWRYLAYHLGADLVATVVCSGVRAELL